MRRPVVFALAILAIGSFVPCVHAQDALERLEQLLRRDPNQPQPAEKVEPGYLGAVADDRDENGRGVRVMKMAENGPAAQAGIRERDLITAIDGRPVRSMQDMARHLEATTPGARMVFDVERDARTIRFPVTLGARPAAGGRLFQEFGKILDPNNPQPQPAEQLPPPEPRPAEAPVPARGVLLGVRTSGLSVEDQVRLRLQTASGARITDVTAGSPAERAGLRVNDVVTSIDGQLVRVPADLSQRTAQAGAGKTVELGFYRNTQFYQMRVRLGDGEPTLAPPQGQAGQVLPAPRQEGALRPPLDPRRLDEKARIEMLEQAVGDLLLRVQQLETELEKARGPAPKAGNPPVNPANRGADTPPPEPGT